MTARDRTHGAGRKTTRLTATLTARDAATLAEVADETGFGQGHHTRAGDPVLAELVRPRAPAES